VSLPRAVAPMMATAAAVLPSGPEWSYEVKWDGYRAQGVKRGAAVTLASRNLANITRQYRGVAEAVQSVHAADAVIDGEIVALDADGRPSFQALHHSDFAGLSIVFYAFDLLHLDGRDLLRVPLDERRIALRGVVSGTGVLLSDALPGTAATIEREVRTLGLEGVVAKRRRSIYSPGRRSDAWIKVRFTKRQELVIGGFKPDPADGFDSLIVGYYEGGALMSAGKVRAGFTPATRAKLMALLKPLAVKRCPFKNLPSAKSGHWGEGISADEMRELRWVKPALVAEIGFTEWTRDGSLRHAAFVALRTDKDPAAVRREVTSSSRA
jgi:bifunctional non-homologous end joining protein LigD